MEEKIILASASPRRKELLSQIGLNFEVIVSEVDENIEVNKPEQLVEELAFLKASAVAKKVEAGLVIGADTIVVHNGKVLGKPKDDLEAVAMLRQLSGNPHKVITGVAVINVVTNSKVIVHETTEVIFRKVEETEIKNYVATGEPMDKAGSYAIQGLASIFVEKINGCYFNVVGLPLHRLAIELKKFNIDIL